VAPRSELPSEPSLPAKRRPKSPGWAVARIFVGAGSEAGVRPADLVGAITNEAGVEGRAIGAIQIGERYSLVEVPEAIVSDVVAALRGTKLKGRKVIIRRDRDGAAPGYQRSSNHVEQ
jgi:ATP-dependent RNA helicase DeaD